MITLQEILMDFVEVAEYHNSLPERYFPEDDYTDEILYDRVETIYLIA